MLQFYSWQILFKAPGCLNVKWYLLLWLCHSLSPPVQAYSTLPDGKVRSEKESSNLFIVNPCKSAVKPTITPNGPTTLCAGGSVLLSASSGKSYLWNTGEKEQAITVSKAGRYAVTVTDKNNCTASSDTIIVSVNPWLQSPVITASTTLAFCESGETILSVPEQDGASYVWLKDGVSYKYNTNVCKVSDPGIYTVELSNFCGKVRSSNSINFKVEPKPEPFTITVQGSTTICKGSSVKLSIPGQKDAKYTWKKDGVSIGANLPEINAQQAGNYTVEMLTVCGTFTSSNSINVDVLPQPATPVTSNLQVCADSSVPLKATGGEEGSYRWYTTASGGTPIQDTFNSTCMVQVKTTTTYYVAISNGRCESNRVPVVVSVLKPPAPVTITLQGKQRICSGQSTFLHTVAIAGTNYNWKRNGSPVGANTNKLTVTETGVYTLEITNDCGTAQATNQVSIEVVPTPPTPVTEDVTSCGSGSVRLKATGGAEGTYRWYETATALDPIPYENGSRFETPVLHQSKTYYVSISSNGCESKRVPVQAIIGAVPIAGVGSSVTLDFGESTVLQGTGGGTYSWSPAEGLSDPNSPNPTARPLKTTLYTLTVTNDDGCKDSAQVEVIVRKELLVPTAFSPNGDGVNDTWVIANIETYPDAKIEVYNRWGNKVFEKEKYDNQWNGTYRGQLLPVSTYFYVITYPKGRQVTGSVSIVQ